MANYDFDSIIKSAWSRSGRGKRNNISSGSALQVLLQIENEKDRQSLSIQAGFLIEDILIEFVKKSSSVTFILPGTNARASTNNADIIYDKSGFPRRVLESKINLNLDNQKWHALVGDLGARRSNSRLCVHLICPIHLEKTIYKGEEIWGFNTFLKDISLPTISKEELVTLFALMGKKLKGNT